MAALGEVRDVRRRRRRGLCELRRQLRRRAGREQQLVNAEEALALLPFDVFDQLVEVVRHSSSPSRTSARRARALRALDGAVDAPGDVRRLGTLGRARGARRLFGSVGKGLLATRTRPVDDRVAGDCVEPGRPGAALRPIAAGRAPDCGERLLHGVLGAAAIAQEAEREAEDRPGEPPVQGVEGCRVSISDSPKEVAVAHAVLAARRRVRPGRERGYRLHLLFVLTHIGASRIASSLRGFCPHRGSCSAARDIFVRIPLEDRRLSPGKRLTGHNPEHQTEGETMRRLMLFVAASALAVPANAAAATKLINVYGTQMKPKAVTIDVGDSVRWVNRDNATHQIVADGGTFASPTLRQGRAYTFTFRTAGTFGFRDVVGNAGRGSVKVIGAPPSVTLGTAAPILFYGQQTMLTGTVSSGQGGETVTISAQKFGETASQRLATTTT